jgi:hypothetical protein
MAYEYIGHRQEASNRAAALASYRRSFQLAEETAGMGSPPDASARGQMLAAQRAIAGALAAAGDRAGAMAAGARQSVFRRG